MTYTAETAARLLSYAESREAMLGRSGSEHAADLRAVLAEVERLQSDAVEDPEVVRSLRADVARLTRERDEARAAYSDAMIAGNEALIDAREAILGALEGLRSKLSVAFGGKGGAIVHPGDAAPAREEQEHTEPGSHQGEGYARPTSKNVDPDMGVRRALAEPNCPSTDVKSGATIDHRGERMRPTEARSSVGPSGVGETGGEGESGSVPPPARRDGPRWIPVRNDDETESHACSRCGFETGGMDGMSSPAEDAAHERACWRPRVAEQEPSIWIHTRNDQKCSKCGYLIVGFGEATIREAEAHEQDHLREVTKMVREHERTSPRPPRADTARPAPPESDGTPYGEAFRDGWLARDALAVTP
jgi:hypothetical protein